MRRTIPTLARLGISRMFRQNLAADLTRSSSIFSRHFRCTRSAAGVNDASNADKFIDFKLLNQNTVYESGSCPGCGAAFHMESGRGLAGFVGNLYRSKSKGIVKEANGNRIKHARTDSTRSDTRLTPLSAKQLSALLEEQSEGSSVVLCDRCYDLKFKSEENGRIFPVNLEKFFEPIRKKQKGVVLLLVDLTDGSSTLVPHIRDLVGTDKPVIVIANKCDALPESAKQHYVKEWLVREFQKEGGFVPNPENIFFCSAKTGEGVFEAMRAVGAQRRSIDDHVFLVGHTNVGKSHFVSSLWRLAGDSERSKLIVSHSPGTTAGYLKLPLNLFSPLLLGPRLEIKEDFGVSEKAKLIDTPGLEIDGSYASLLTLKELRLVEFKNPIMPKSYPLVRGQTIFVGGLARVDVLESSKAVSVNVFTANTVPTHVTQTLKADAHYERHLASPLSNLRPPLGGQDRKKTWPSKLIKGSFSLCQKGGNRNSAHALADLSLPGIGWLSFSSQYPQTIRINVHVPEGVFASLREPMLPVAHHSGRKFKLTSRPQKKARTSAQPPRSNP